MATAGAWLLPVVFLAVCARAAPRENFAEAPQLRAEKAEQVRERAQEQKRQARRWALRHGLKLRHEEGGRTLELMALRNGRPLFYTTQNDQAAISVAADQVRNRAPYGVDGRGVRVGIWDGGSVLTNHQEFSGRITLFDDASAHFHATHVAGTICASGVVARARGMAPQALVDSYDWNSDEAEMLSAAASYPGEPGKLYLSNHSYGILAGWFYASWLNPWSRRSGYHWWGDLTRDKAEEYFGQYGSGPREWDELVYNAPYFLPFKAAGNERDDAPVEGTRVYYTPDNGDTWTNTLFDPKIHPLGDAVYKSGYDTIPYLGNAKNIVTVGAVDDAVLNGTRAPSAAAMTVFSSWGPADDGRIKPDLVANGSGLYSCNSSGAAAYAVRSGTSMASPNACGAAALLVDLFGRLHPGGAMRASTLKGLLIHTADDLGRPGPDYQYGWGLVNVHRAAELLRRHSLGNSIGLIESRLMDWKVDEEQFTAYSYGGAGNPVRVTLCWTDPPGRATDLNDSRTPVLVNDLDLRVTGPRRRWDYYPFSLDYEHPEAPATTDDENRVDNVEQVLIEVPEPGFYTITVGKRRRLQDGEQWYSLLTSGLEVDSDGNGLPDAWEADFFANSTGTPLLEDADGDGMNNLSEFIAGSDPTDPSSRFRIASVEAPPAENGTPFVIHWDSVPGRIYTVTWSYNLPYVPFSDVSGDLSWPVNSYTDTVDRTGMAALYKLEVRMEQ